MSESLVKARFGSRLEHALDSLRHGRILWVDDHPEWNNDLIRLFERSEMVVDTVRSTEEALTRVWASAYDLVITDMWRDTEHPSATAGLTLMDALRRVRTTPPVVIYAAQFDPKLGMHPVAFGYAKHANALVHLVIDIMERAKFDLDIRDI
jgi:DNA-binding NtrC family response regulator